MQELGFEICYCKGATNEVAYALSRIFDVNALSFMDISIDFYLSIRLLTLVGYGNESKSEHVARKEMAVRMPVG